MSNLASITVLFLSIAALLLAVDTLVGWVFRDRGGNDE